MHRRNTPTTGPRYWTLIALASVFGADTGDFFAHDLGLGHLGGLPILAAAFAGTLLVERRLNATDAAYWIAIVLVRTAATNVGDFATHDLRLSYPATITCLAIVLAAALLTARQRDPDRSANLPPVDALYWLSMLLAGTLGTAGGDFIAHSIGLPQATLATCTILAALLALRAGDSFATKSFCWLCVVAIRTAGTNVGDITADHVGLPLATAVAGLAMLATFLIWRETGPIPIEEGHRA
jgi:uncharacterized membrane-anchored protein